MYPYLKNNIEIHYIDNYSIALNGSTSLLLSDVETYIINKLDGEKSVNAIVNEIADELGTDDKSQIENIVYTFLKDNPDLIIIGCTPDLHQYKKSGVEGKKYPYNIISNLTNKCNLICAHCYKSCSSANNDFIPYNKLINTLSHLKDKSKNIQLTGGEPMLHKSFFDILEYCINNFSTTVTTSATLVNSKNVHNFCGVKDVQVSLYSYEKFEHENITSIEGSYEKTLNGIKLLVKNYIPVTIASIVTKRNINQIKNMIDFLLNIGVTNTSFGLFSKGGRGLNLSEEWLLSIDEQNQVASILNELSEKYKGKINISIWNRKHINPECKYEFEGLACGAGLITWTISENGNIKPCDFFPDHLFSFGNILEQNIEDIVNNYSLENLTKGILEWDKFQKKNNSSLLDICQMIENYRLCNS